MTNNKTVSDARDRILTAKIGSLGTDASLEYVDALLEEIDYLHGRVMKINLKSDTEFDPRLYNRDLGEGAAERVIQSLR